MRALYSPEESLPGLFRRSFGPLSASPEMGTRAAARTVAKPFRWTKVPIGWEFWQSGGPPVVVLLAKNGFSGQLLRLTVSTGKNDHHLWCSLRF